MDESLTSCIIWYKFKYKNNNRSYSSDSTDTLLVGRFDGKTYEFARWGSNQLSYEKIAEVVEESRNIQQRWQKWTGLSPCHIISSVGEALWLIFILMMVFIIISVNTGWMEIVGMIAVIFGLAYLMERNRPEKITKRYLDRMRFPKTVKS